MRILRSSAGDPWSLVWLLGVGAFGALIFAAGCSSSAGPGASFGSAPPIEPPSSGVSVIPSAPPFGFPRRISLAAGGVAANGDSAFSIALSDDGTQVFFSTRATNLAPGSPSGTFSLVKVDGRTSASTVVSAP